MVFMVVFVTQNPHIWGGVKGMKALYIGAPGGIRTHNLLIRSQALYPLSYGGLPVIIPEKKGGLLALEANYTYNQVNSCMERMAAW
jgi:hypothetical protein